MSARPPSRDRFTLAQIRLAKLSTLQLVSVLSVFFLGDNLLSSFEPLLLGDDKLSNIKNLLLISETFDRACATPSEQRDDFISGEVYKKTESVDEGLIETEEVYCDKGTFFFCFVFTRPDRHEKKSFIVCLLLVCDIVLSIKRVIISESQRVPRLGVIDSLFSLLCSIIFI